MRNTGLTSLIFAFLTTLSVTTTAAPSIKPEGPAPITAQTSKAEQSAKVNLNAADAETLRSDLFGIGAAKAKAIVAYRESNGPFTAIDGKRSMNPTFKALS